MLHVITSLTASAMVTFTVTHMHQAEFALQLELWLLHWVTAWPIAFVTIRYIAPIYKKLLGVK